MACKWCPQNPLPSEADYASLCPFFAFLSKDTIRETFSNSTQYGFMPHSPDGNLFKRFKAPQPATNVLRLNDKATSDSVFSNTPVIDGGEKGAQIWFGQKCHVIYAEKIKTTADYLRTLQNFVREYGAPDAIICDHANYQSSGRVLDVKLLT